MGRLTVKLGGDFRAATTPARSKSQQRGNAGAHGTRTLTLIALVATALGVLTHSLSLEAIERGLRHIQLQLHALGLG